MERHVDNHHHQSNNYHDPNHSDHSSDAQPSSANNETTESEWYPWMRSVGWMRQIQPIPPEQLPRPAAPIVYEGFVPQSQESYTYPPVPGSGPSFPWPALEEPSLIPADASMRQNFGPNVDVLHDSDVTSSDEAEDEDIESTLQAFTSGSKSSRRKSTVSGRGKAPKPHEPAAASTSKRRGRRKNVRNVVEPSEDFRVLHAQATEAFLDHQDLERALDLILQAITINPEIYSAHVLLSEIYFAQKDDEKAMAALFSGAHASPNDPTVWHQLADACLQKSIGDRVTVLKQASYCFSRILGIDRNDTDARFQRAVISKELGYHAKALKDANELLQTSPHNSEILRLIAEVCLQVGDVTYARRLYEDALEEQQLRSPAIADAFTWADLIVHVDLVLHADGVEEAIRTLKEVARWLAGRGAETFWNHSVDDDREWDAEHEPRRTMVPSFQPDIHPLESYGTALPIELRVKLGELRILQGNKKEALDHFEWLNPEAGNSGTLVFEFPDLFLQVADSLRNQKDLRQAWRYYDALHSINAYEDADFWIGIGACSLVCSTKVEALHFYEQALAADSSKPEIHTQLAKLYAQKHDRALAIKHAREALRLYELATPKTQKRKYERKETREAREEAQNAYRKAYMLTPPPEEKVKALMPSFSRRAREKARRKARDEQDDEDAESVPDVQQNKSVARPKRRLTKAQRSKEQQEENVRQLHSTMCLYTAAMRAGDEEARSLWIEHAEALVDEFRSNRVLYPNERYKTFQGYDHQYNTRRKVKDPEVQEPIDTEDVPLPSVESVIPDDYCGITFTAWLDMFLEYALLLANLEYEATEVYAIIDAAQTCAVWYHDLEAMTQIYICYMVCTLALRDEITLFNTVLRWFMREYMFCSDAYRLFSVINYYYEHNLDKGGKAGQMAKAQFRVPPTQKFVFRHLMHLDSQLPANYGEDTLYGPVPSFMRKEKSDVRLSNKDQHQALTDRIHSRSHSQSNSRPTTPITRPAQPIKQPDQGVKTLSPQEMEITLLTLYGQLLYAGGTFASALSYFYRALSLDPHNPVLLLTMALCYMHEVFKRTNDQKHMYFLQGWSFFEEYAEVRTRWAQEKQASTGNIGLMDTVRREIEFNRARCWHMNGMADLAVRGYERMMDLKRIKGEDEDEDRMDVDNDGNGNGHKDNEYSMEAAYAMAVIYATNGNTEMAREITEKWLTVE